MGSTNPTTSPTPGIDATTPEPYRLSMQIINVCGLKRKLLLEPFRETLSQFDISLLCETKLDNADIELVQESISDLKLKAFFKNRRTLTPWRSGGLCVIFKEHIEQYLTHVITKCKLVQWLKIDKALIGTDKNVMIGNTYIPPNG